MTKIPVIVGPTSTGKTSLAIELCTALSKLGHKSQILSADSRQIYKKMDIGTGKKPLDLSEKISVGDTKWTKNGVDILGYDLVFPDQTFSSFEYAEFALSILKKGIAQKNMTILVGGTGFYIDAVTGRAQQSNVIPDFEYRKTLEMLETEKLAQKLMSLNLEVYNNTDVKNRNRLIRAIERENPSKKIRTPLPLISDVQYVYYGLTAPNEFLYQRVDAWLDTIWRNGLLDETNELIKLGYKDSPRMHGLVYKSALEFTEGTLAEQNAIQRAKFDLHAYTRRQLTWFKKNKEIKWFDILNSTKNEISNKILSDLKLS